MWGALEKKGKLAAGFDGMLRAEEGFASMLLSGRERDGERQPGGLQPTDRRALRLEGYMEMRFPYFLCQIT